MSEYQYYEFQAIDRPLTADEMRELRATSSRATITSTRFVNEYNWGSFKGDATAFMEKYFDAFLYLANWGTHELMLRFPVGVLPLETAERYCRSEFASAKLHDDIVILSFYSEDEGGDMWIQEDGGSLASILPVRAEIASGDHRALYLGWLLGIQEEWYDDEDEEGHGGDEPEPPVPPGLGKLSGALKAFRDFLRIDPFLVEAAAQRSGKMEPGPGPEALHAWIAALSEAEKTALLARAAAGEGAFIGAELRVRFHRETRPQPAAVEAKPRTAGELRAIADRLAEAHERAEAERAAAEKARRARAAAEARARHLDGLAGREEELWRQADLLAASKRPQSYDEAVKLLRDLRDLAARDGREAEYEVRLEVIRERHAKKPSFLDRLRKAGLLPH